MSAGFVKVEQGHIPARVVVSGYVGDRRVYCESVPVTDEEKAIEAAQRAVGRSTSQAAPAPQES